MVVGIDKPHTQKQKRSATSTHVPLICVQFVYIRFGVRRYCCVHDARLFEQVLMFGAALDVTV